MEAKEQQGVRDLSTYSDTRMVKIVLRATLVYLAVGTVYFAWFFSRYACGGPESPCSWDPAASDSTTLYPNYDDAGSLSPLLDAIVFMLSVSTTVGWGSQPTDLTTRHERGDTRNHSMLFDSTKLLLCFLSFVGVVAIGLILGTTGDTFRAICRKKVHERVAKALRKQRRMMLKARKSKKKPAELVKSAHEHSSVLEDHDHLIAVLMLALCIMMGTVAYMMTETECVRTTDVKEICRDGDQGDQNGGWQYLNFVDALYLTVISVSTVGFGDYAPSTTGSKLFTIIYLPVAVGFTANAVDHVSTYLINKRVRRLENFVLSQYGGTEDRGVGSRDAGGAGLTAYDFEELQRSVELDHTKPLSRNDFRLAVSMRRATILTGRYELDSCSSFL